MNYATTSKLILPYRIFARIKMQHAVPASVPAHVSLIFVLVSGRLYMTAYNDRTSGIANIGTGPRKL